MYNYQKDHLGNVRVVFNERDSVEQVTHYYPFGGSFGEQHRRSRAALPLHWQGAGPLPGP